MDDFRIGIVGSGGMATRRAQNFTNLDGCGVAAIAARNPDTGPSLAEQFGAELTTDWKTLIGHSDIQAIVVATHNALHGAITTAALEAGQHVFSEYPTARTPIECARISELIDGNTVLRLTHNAHVTAEHRALREATSKSGVPVLSHFLRLTPGRGRRPEVLFNLNLSGPPALFFVYQVHPYVKLFGAATSVHCEASYGGLRDDTGYDRFANILTVRFENGTRGQWTWAGGIAIDKAIQEAHIVTSDATFIETGDGWDIATPDGTSSLEFGENEQTLERLFLSDVQGETDWQTDLRIDLESDWIALAAEQSAIEGRVVELSELRAP
jgi:biliverdin reductase